jgi:hypothetical protein
MFFNIYTYVAVSWTDYAQTYDEYVSRLKSLGLELREVGRSARDRPIYAVYAGSGPAVFITAGQHGNEHPGPELMLHFLRDLKTCNFLVKEGVLCRVRYVVVPVVNPDGFDAWQRTNANHVDPNRNWPAGWGGPGSMPGSCCAICRGSSPLDQPETRAVYSLLSSESYAIHIDLHSGTEVLAWPPGCAQLGASRFTELYKRLAQRHAEIASKYGITPYDYGNIIERYADVPPEFLAMKIYEACGAVDDTVDYKLNKPSFVLEISSPYNPTYSALTSYYYPRLQAVLASLAEYAYSTQPPVATPMILPILAGTVSAFSSALYMAFEERKAFK